MKGVLERGPVDEIGSVIEERLQCLLEAEVGVEVTRALGSLDLCKEVDIASRWVGGVRRCRSEPIEAPHSELVAQPDHAVVMTGQFIDHAR